MTAPRQDLPFEYPYRWAEGLREHPFVDLDNELRVSLDQAEWLERRDRELEDFLAGIGGGGVPTVFVAASNAKASSREAADFVCSGSSDQTTLASALASLTAAVGRVVLSEGTFTLDGDWNITTVATRIHVMGMGMSTILTQTNSGSACIRLNNTGSDSLVAISDIYFDNNDLASAPGVQLDAVAEDTTEIRGCRFIDCSRGIEISDNCAQTRVTNCSFESCSRGIFWQRPERSIVANSTFVGCQYGIEINDPSQSTPAGENSTIIGCTFEDCSSYSIYARGGGIGVIGCSFYNDTGPGNIASIYFYNFNWGSGSPLGQVVSGCHFILSEVGVYMQECHHNLIVGNYFYDCTDAGVEIGSRSSDNSIIGNYFWDSDIITSGTYGANNLVTTNTFTDGSTISGSIDEYGAGNLINGSWVGWGSSASQDIAGDITAVEGDVVTLQGDVADLYAYGAMGML